MPSESNYPGLIWLPAILRFISVVIQQRPLKGSSPFKIIYQGVTLDTTLLPAQDKLAPSGSLLMFCEMS